MILQNIPDFTPEPKNEIGRSYLPINATFVVNYIFPSR